MGICGGLQVPDPSLSYQEPERVTQLIMSGKILKSLGVDIFGNELKYMNIFVEVWRYYLLENIHEVIALHNEKKGMAPSPTPPSYDLDCCLKKCKGVGLFCRSICPKLCPPKKGKAHDSDYGKNKLIP